MRNVVTLNKDLLIACECNSICIVKLLLEHYGADINSVITYMPLTMAGLHGHLEIVKYLVAKPNIDVYLRGKAGYTALAVACNYANEIFARFLLNEIDNIEREYCFR